MRILFASAAAVFSLLVVGVACSSSDSSSSTSSCSCSVSDNGASATIKCGESSCVGTTTYSCSSTAAISQGGACTPATTSSSTSSSSGSTTSSSSSSSGSAATTVPCAYHDFNANKDVTTCDAKTQYCLRSYQQSEGPGSDNVCAPLPSGCTGCDCASDDAEAAWKAAEDNTINCTGSTNLCNDSNGAIIVDCVK